MAQEVLLSIDQALHAAVEMMTGGLLKEAEQVFRNILKLDPNNFHALNHLGTLLAEKKEFYEALYRIDRAIKVNKRHAPAISNRGMVLGQLGHYEESETEFRRAIYIEPKNPIYWSNLGNTLERSRKYEEAYLALNKAIALDPNHGFTYLNRGVVLMRLGRQRDAVTSFDKAVELNPTLNEAVSNRGNCKLLLGDLKGGWPDYEYRLKIPEEGTYYVGPFEQPKWTGKEPLEGKTIMLHGEQGLGDTLQFMRYIPEVQKRNPKEILIVIHAALYPIIEAMGLRIVRAGESYPPFDYYSPIMSLPLAFDTVEETIPPPFDMSGYVKPSLPPTDKFRVGVCWSGNWQQKNDHNRSIPLEDFSLILRESGVEYVNLQKDIREMDKECLYTLQITEVPLDTLLTTANLIVSCDLIVSVDTSVAHLAGTLRVPTWMLTPSLSPHWPWILGRDDTHWYPSMRVIRQQKDGTWKKTLENVRKELRSLSVQVAAKVA